MSEILRRGKRKLSGHAILVGRHDPEWRRRAVALRRTETAPIDERDVAAVAARSLHEDGHTGADYVLTGPGSLSQAEQVSIIGEGIGRRIRFQELSPDDFRRETGRQLAPSDRGYAARRVGCDDRTSGVRDLHRRRRCRIAATHVSAVGRLSRRRVSGSARQVTNPQGH